ncbi:hypothetical protein M406DRAFT_62284 [Cryphonectria parasitica EP155]|uniref:D-lactate dehydrogenase (cytochrome) n=1 Tax=Cryphonectria parasitica (strain ATCC 38755 / EP155) TaxID=660469 RepID=A0A9P4Y0T0_CRYP1|nr:uncharacterized protein M406DRAFT_62284 [Cryphonectria parasitica EP155]KAF3764578.1 hypothetical protein M406DRAFT_62284 [Cryphonectria parasitica EP155]
MLESITQRMAREKEELRQAAIEREARSGGGRNLATTVVVVLASLMAFYCGTKLPRDPEPTSTLPLSVTRPPRHNVSPAELEAAWTDFVEIVGKENVSTLQDVLLSHAQSEWSTHNRPASEPMPFCVVYPATTDEVSRIMKVCHKRRIPVTGYSGGTSLEGHFAPTRGGICVDFGRMDQVLALHKEDLDVVVQPAVGWEYLNEQLADEGLFFPPDPGPGAMIGGMIGTGCSGTNAYRYGTMREWVLSLTVVLADGTVIKTRQRPRKSSAGYDLTKLFIGSEGTLGLVTEATLKVTVRPATTSVAVCSFGSIRQAADCVGRVVGSGVPVAAVEILDDEMMKCINKAGHTARAWQEAPTLFFKFAGTDKGVKEQIEIVRQMAKKAGSTGFDFAKSQEEQLELWSARKEALWSTMAVKRDGDKVWTGDVAVPISRLPDIIEETKKDVQESGLYGTIVGHVGDGNFHTILLYSDAERKVAEEVVHRMVKRAVEMEGTVTGEHGVGLVKRDYLPHELGASTVDVMRKMKQSFDPLCLLNCDKVVRMQKPAAGEIAEW